MDLLAGHDLVNKNGNKVLANHALKVTMSHKSDSSEAGGYFSLLTPRFLDFIIDIIIR